MEEGGVVGEEDAEGRGSRATTPNGETGGGGRGGEWLGETHPVKRSLGGVGLFCVMRIPVDENTGGGA